MQNLAICCAQVMLAQLIIGCASGSSPVGQAVSETQAQSNSSALESASALAVAADDGSVEGDTSESDPMQRDAGETGFTRVRIGDKRIVYVNENYALESYDNWLIEPAIIEFSKDQKPLKDADLLRLETMLEEMQRSQTAESGAPIVSAASPCTLKQNLKLSALQLNTLDDAVSQISMVRSFGSAVVRAEVRDSQTNDLVFAYSAAASLGGGIASHGGPQIERLDKVLRRVLRKGHEAMLTRFPLSEDRIDDRKQFGCSGLLGRNAFQRRGGQAAAP